MRSRGWLLLGMLACPALAPAQTVTEADLIGPWAAVVEYPWRKEPKERVALVLWPDGLWYYTSGRFVGHNHGGARWQLVGDTLWLADDYFPYFHPMSNSRFGKMVRTHGHLGVLDTAIINKRPPYPVPDSVYWSKTFRDTTSTCAGSHPCPTWVYKVSKRDQQIHLVLLESLSRSAKRAATTGVLTRDSLMGCAALTLRVHAGNECRR